MTKFELREGMVWDYISGVYDTEIKVLWKNPKYYGEDDGPYIFIDMIPASNGFFYKYDKPNKRFVLSVYKGKFQVWDVKKYLN